MSSTTDTGHERGQILVIFGVSLLVIIAVAALVFDGGFMLLARRTQQNAADAASLAGARYLPADDAAALTAATDAAVAVATENGFTDGVDSVTVDVNIPPLSGPNQDLGHIEVIIESEQPSIFSAIWGFLNLGVDARAVATNNDDVAGPFALLSLDPSDCHALIVEGQGQLISNGNIQVNSTCEPNAMRVAGQADVIAPGQACNVVGGYEKGGSATVICSVDEDTATEIPDPLLGLPEPPETGGVPPDFLYPDEPDQEVGSMDIPQGCPGSATPATDAAPAECRFPGSYAATTWRLHPGYYPGGLHIEAGKFYLEPGIYYFAGGGITIHGGTASVITVDSGESVLGGGVLLYNGDHPTAPDGAIVIEGGNSGVQLWPANLVDDPTTDVDEGAWNGIVLFQDRDVCLDARIVGASSSMEVRGTIYIPGGDSCPALHPVLIAEGNGGTVVTDQVIAYRFQMKGNIGSLTVAFDEDFIPSDKAAGLVE